MLKRRDFLKKTEMAALSGLAVCKAVASGSFWETMPPAGVQLYTYFNVIDADVPGTLQKIADIGYKNIESPFSKKGGYYGMTPKAFAALVKDKGLSWKSHHVLGAPFQLPPGRKMPNGPDGKPIVIPPMKNLRDNMQELVDEAAEGGIPYLVCASIPLNTTDEIKAAMNTLNKTDEACKKAGIQFAYFKPFSC
jgi:sugar phosphate isomerase/epimerase